MTLARWSPFVVAAAVAAAALPAARAQSPSTQPIRMLVPVTAGAGTDVTARVLADALRESLGQPVVVQNRPGATGRIAAEALKRAAPDGTTFLLAPMVVAVLAPLIFRDPGYDASKDLVPVAQVSRYALAMAVRPDHPARTVPEFVAWARANPAQASLGTGGSGSLPHLLGVLIGRATDTQFVHVPYSSLAQVETELLGGQIAAAIGNVGDFVALDRTGSVAHHRDIDAPAFVTTTGGAHLCRTGIAIGGRGRLECHVRAVRHAEGDDRRHVGRDRKRA